MARVISVISGKGGVGKTTVSINLATALMGLGERVLLVDADLETPCVSVHLGTPSVPITLTSAIKGKHHIDDTVYVHSTGLRVVPASLAMHNFTKTNITKLGKAIDALKKKADIIVIDSPPGIGNIVRMILSKSDQTIIVTNPELPALSDAIKAAKLAEHHETTVLGVVVNKVDYEPEFEVPAHDVEALIEYPIIAALPSEKHVKRALSSYVPVVTHNPYSKFSHKINLLAGKLVGKSDQVEMPRKSFLMRIFGWMQ